MGDLAFEAQTLRPHTPEMGGKLVTFRSPRSLLTKQDGRGGGVLWIVLILVVAVGYEAFDAASRFAGIAANDVLHREK
jgi:hypothetical protein